TTPAPNDSATVNTHISIIFSEKMNVATLNAGTIVFEPSIPGSFSIQASRQVLITPAQPLDTFVTYTATVTTAVADSSGNPMASDYVWQFRTVRDWIPPQVLIERPSDHSVFTDSVQVAAAASDNDGLSHIEFYADGDLVHNAINGASDYYEFTWRPSGLIMGSQHDLYAVAYDLAGNAAHSDTVVVHYLWRLLAEDNNEAIPRNLARIYARSTRTQLQFRVETWTGWGDYKSPTEGIDVAIFLDTDQNPATGQTRADNGTKPIGDIGAEYRIVIGNHGDVVDQWTGSGWVDNGNVENLVISNNSDFFEVSVSLGGINAPSGVDLIVANVILNTAQWDWAPNVDNVPPDHVTLLIDNSYSGAPPQTPPGIATARPLQNVFD
ncbi:MAG: Ig-like domain-containing protein, partial [Candidatus Zixiibacteriota bacterium]